MLVRALDILNTSLVFKLSLNLHLHLYNMSRSLGSASPMIEHEHDDTPRVCGYLGDRNDTVQSPASTPASIQQSRMYDSPSPIQYGVGPSAQYPCMNPYYTAPYVPSHNPAYHSTPAYPTYPMPFAPSPAPFQAQPYPMMYPGYGPPYYPYNSYFIPNYIQPTPTAPHGAYNHPSQPTAPSSPGSVCSDSPSTVIFKLTRSPSTTSLRSASPPASPPPVLTADQFVQELQQIRLQTHQLSGPLGRFCIQGEAHPVSVSRPRQDGPFMIQHYSRDGRADVVSIAHVFEFDGEGSGRGVIVWCPPPKVEYYGMGV
jgi:hypothetical protein